MASDMINDKEESTTTTTSTFSTNQNEEEKNHHQNNTSNSGDYLIKKCSMFDSKQKCKQLFEMISQIVEGKFEDEDDTDNREIKGHNRLIEIDKDLQRQTSYQSQQELIIEQQIENLTVSTKFYCTTCNLNLADREDQIEHYKCDLHLYNLKQKLKGKSALNAEQFENLSDISSISGGSDDEHDIDHRSSSSESDNEETKDEKCYAHIARNKPKIMFKLTDNTIVSMLRCVLHGKKDIPESREELLNKVKSISCDDHWCVILVAAGHFAAAIFKGDQVVCHKTFHRYVVRAKRGTVQSQHDNTGKYAKSAGACIRRNQEASFKEDIRFLIGTEWKKEIDKCKCVFIRVPSYHRTVLISGSSEGNQLEAPFNKNDKRIRHIPFMTFRPTFKEVKRAHAILSRLEHYNESYIEYQSNYKQKLNDSLTAKIENKNNNKKNTCKKSSKKPEKPVIKKEKCETEIVKENKPVSTSETESIVEEVESKIEENEFIQNLSQEEMKQFNEIYTSVFTNNSNKLQEILTTNSSYLLNKRLNKDNGYTLLHLASKMGHSECVWLLLLNGSDPALSDLTHKMVVPYLIATSKQTRDQFRRFMNDFPEKYDYEKAKISSPLSAEKQNEKLEKEKEKKKLAKKAKRERDQLKKAKEKQEQDELNERNKFLAMSEAEKNATIVRCWTCAKDLTNLVPFTYCDYKFCSTICLRNHRVDNLNKKK